MKKQSRAPQSKAEKEISAGAIAFAIRGKEIKVLLLLANKPDEYYVEIGPKGHIERGESPLQAASREIKEEIGLRLHIDTNFRKEENYTFLRNNPKTGVPERVIKKVIYFIAFMSDKDLKQIAISEEHKKYFLVPIDQAIGDAEFPEQKPILESAKEYVTSHYLMRNQSLFQGVR